MNVLALVVALVITGQGPCEDGLCRVRRIPAPAAPGPPNIVEVVNTRNFRSGTGTIVADDGEVAIVLSVAHIFEGGTVPALVRGSWGQATSTFTTIDKYGEDISAIVIPSPGVPVISVAEKEPSVRERVTFSGYGLGEFQTFAGVVTEVTGAELRVSGVNRHGDSGGPVLNAIGELIGVQWGNNFTDSTVATCCPHILRFLHRVRQKIGFRVRQILPEPGPWLGQKQLEAAPTQPCIPSAPPAPPDLGWEPIQSAPPPPLPVPEPSQAEIQNPKPEPEPGIKVEATKKAGVYSLAYLVGMAGGGGLAGAIGMLALQAGIHTMERRWQRKQKTRRHSPESPRVQQPPQRPTETTPPPASTPRESKSRSIHLGWSDEDEGRVETRNRYVRVEQTDMLGEAYKRAIAQYAEANPKAASFLQQIEAHAESVFHGLGVASRMKPPTLDNPLIYPKECTNE